MIHPYVLGIMGDLAEARDVTALRKNACPVCVCNGDNDFALRTPGMREQAKSLPGSQYLPWVEPDKVCVRAFAFPSPLLAVGGSCGLVCVPPLSPGCPGHAEPVPSFPEQPGCLRCWQP